MNEPNYFDQNVKRWSLFCPQAAALLPVFAKLGEYKGKAFSDEEMAVWIQKLDFRSFQLLYVYGLNPQLPYKPLQNWCEHNNHHLVILEDNLEVIAQFFQQKEAAELLANQNVWLYYLDPSHRILDETAKLFSILPYTIATIHSDEEKLKTLQDIKTQLDFLHNLYRSQVLEYAQHGVVYFKNFYKNLFAWPNGYLGNALYGKFKNVPAIVCGAGPSLAKNIELLKQLKDRALIFAGGSAINGLNAANINPHLALGVDPNETHITRTIMQTTFETPFLYRGRLQHAALNLVHGDKLYVTGSIGYGIGEYFEKHCGIAGEEVEEGCNVINFSLAVAEAMGCNPIILVGVDLAYSNNQSYAPGMLNHPIHQTFKTKGYNEEIVYRLDINDQPVATLWKWITESLWFTSFSERHPSTKIVNATEGGIGFAGIENMTLAAAADKYLGGQHALSCRLQGDIQSGKMPADLTLDKLFNLFDELDSSILSTLSKLLELKEELASMQKALPEIDGEAPIDQDKAAQLIKSLKERLEGRLKQEISVQYILNPFNVAYELFNWHLYRRLELDRSLMSEKKWTGDLLSLEAGRLLFLQKTLEVNDLFIKDILNHKPARLDIMASQERPAPLAPSPASQAPMEQNSIYRFDNGEFMIEDAECQLDVHENFSVSTLDVERLLSEDGQLKFESFKQNGLLHGPSRAYSAEGKLLAESWYLDGVQEGKAFGFYQSGSAHFIQRYKHGLQQGKQEYFYENGARRAILNYEAGCLHGEILIFHPNGQLARQLNFKHGKRHGVEYLWNEQGVLQIEAHFHENLPTQQARVWHWNGMLAQEFIFNADSDLISISCWDENGQPINMEASGKDFFEQVASSSQELTDNISKLFKELVGLAPFLTEMQTGDKSDQEAAKEIQDLAKGLYELAGAIEQLQKINAQLTKEASHTPNQGEAYWKTAALQREIENKLNASTSEMKNQLSMLQAALTAAIEALLKKKAAQSKDQSG